MSSVVDICNEEVEASTVVRNLGAIFDCHMSMDHHVSKICQSANFHLRKVALLKRYLTQDSLHTLVQSLVISRLDYANSLLAGAPASQLQRLQKVQNHAARILTGVSSRAHVNHILFTLHWLPIEQRVMYKLACFVFKALHGLAPLYISEMLELYRPKRTLRSQGDIKLLSVPRTNCVTFGDRAFAAAAPRVWNCLPREVRELSSYQTFRKHLKTCLFKLAYH